MDAADLKFFEEVAQSGGMSRAAKKLNTVQSNVTRRIRTLESELNVSLFNRTGRGVSLTPAGEQLLPFAIRVARLIDEAARAISDDGRPKGSLVVGSLETTAALRLTPFLSQFVADFPEVDFSLKTGTSRELVEDVLEHRLEGAFVCGPVHHPDLLQRKMYQERLVLLTARRETSLSAYLRKNDLRMVVLRAGCSYRLILEVVACPSRHRRRSPSRVRHARGDHRLRRGRPRHDAASRSPCWAGLAGRAGRRPSPAERLRPCRHAVRPPARQLPVQCTQGPAGPGQPRVRPTPDGQAASVVAQAVNPQAGSTRTGARMSAPGLKAAFGGVFCHVAEVPISDASLEVSRA